MGKRILVLSASVGAGHMRAAQAVALALEQTDPQATVQNVDVLELTNAPFRRLYGKAYLDLVNKAPHFLGYLYDRLDRPRPANSKRDRLRLAMQKLNLTRFVDLLHAEPWDLIVNTHFLPAEIIASLRRAGKLDVPQVIVTTDFDTHRLWVHQPAERFFAATEEGAAYLAYMGIPAESIRVTGIPIHPVFAQAKPRQECLDRQGLVGDRPVVLQLAGGFGVGPIEQIYRSILEVPQPVEVVVVSGRNAAVREQLGQVPCPPRHRCKILGFTDQMDELLAVADLVITKPGGLTTSETLARGAAMVILNPIPGQESRNSDWLLENGAAIKVNNLPLLAHKLSGLLAEPERIERLKANARRLGRPRAAFEVAQEAMKVAGLR